MSYFCIDGPLDEVSSGLITCVSLLRASAHPRQPLCDLIDNNSLERRQSHRNCKRWESSAERHSVCVTAHRQNTLLLTNSIPHILYGGWGSDNVPGNTRAHILHVPCFDTEGIPGRVGPVILNGVSILVKNMDAYDYVMNTAHSLETGLEQTPLV
jgi:hypothetical protein